ncbi:MAG: ABC transporter substrate-binding protein [Chloroflexi bacterium]|nr:ABC transporter substrate-binding protein [Chloroflexota bacterium]
MLTSKPFPKPIRWSELVTILALLTLAACSPTAAPPSPPAAPAAPAAPAPQAATAAPTPPAVKAPPRPITFMAGYKPQANLPFVAAYVAQEKGLFAEQGLDVTIRHATKGEHLQLLLAGQIQVTTAAAESVLKRIADPGAPVVALALFGQTGDQGYVSLTSANLANPKSWEGKTVGYKLFPNPDYLAMLQAAGVDRSKIKEVSVGFDPRVVLEKRVDVYPVFVSNEPALLRRQGADVTVTKPGDYGIATLGLTYISTRDLVDRESDLLERFVKATLKATAMVIDSPEMGVDAVMKVAPEEDRDHQRQMLLTELAEAQSDLTRQRGIGSMTEAQWRTLHDSLLQYGGIAKPIDPTTAFTDRFLQKIYQNGRMTWP